MGVYLSTPVTDLSAENGSGYGLKYSVGEIQGWRKSMEDAHISCTDLARIDPLSEDYVSVFGVFDGHGGKEVAKFCQVHFLTELINLEHFQKRSFIDALRACFHRMDDLLEDESFDPELQQYKKIPHPSEKRNIEQHSDGNDSDDDDKKLPNASSLTFFLENLEREMSKLKAMDKSSILLPISELSQDPSQIDNIGQNQIQEVAATVNSDTLLTPPAESPTTMNNNSLKICNLQEHRIIAGCTAVVALKYKNILYVANAGDSRAVLCRGDGTAYALSEDHKPQSETEMGRIVGAGGFVNAVGRINGNLNLSRAIGDLKYKQSQDLAKAQQIITSDPDISVTHLLPDDKFFIMACDGVWDVFSNQDACNFVSEKLEQGMALQDIINEIFLFAVAKNPRETGGIGGDNMTCIIVQLQQN